MTAKVDIARLRELLKETTSCSFWNRLPELRDEAVNALPALLDELERLRAENISAGQHASNWGNRCAELEAENERLRAALKQCGHDSFCSHAGCHDRCCKQIAIEALKGE